MIDRKHLHEVMEKGVDDLFALCQKFEEENAALSKDLERQVELNHAQLQEIERLRALVDMCEGALSEYTNVVKSVNDAHIFTPMVIDSGRHARDALTAIRKHREHREYRENGDA